MINGLEFEGLRLRSKVPIPFVEENIFLPERIFVEGYFPIGTIVTFERPVCSKKTNAFDEQVNDYCHAAALIYSNKLNGADPDEDDYQVIFHVDLSALFLMFDPIDADGNLIPLE